MSKIIFLGFILLCLPFASNAHAQTRAGTAVAIEGFVLITRANVTRQAQENEFLFMNDTITTGRGSRMVILFQDQTEISLAENTVLEIDEYVYDPRAPIDSNMKVDVLRGTFSFASGLINKRKVQIDIPQGSLGIRGTQFIAGEQDREYKVFVNSGAVEVRNFAGSTIVNPNQYTGLRARNIAPSRPTFWDQAEIARFTERLTFEQEERVRALVEDARQRVEQERQRIIDEVEDRIEKETREIRRDIERRLEDERKRILDRLNRD